MNKKIFYINIAFEDVIQETVIEKLINQYCNQCIIQNRYTKGGYGYLKKSTEGFNQASKYIPFIVVTDLDRAECAPNLIKDWLKQEKEKNLVFRVAVREIESWLIADRQEMAKFLNINIIKIETNIENIPNPKQYLFRLVELSPNSKLRKDILPIDSTAKIGKKYNEQMNKYVREIWRPEFAKKSSDSLNRAINAIKRLNNN